MKTSFKKSLAVFMAALMLLTVFGVSAFAATTYSVTIKPGQYAKETTETVYDGIEKNEYLVLPGETYTRTGYTQTGWSTNVRGTSRTYTLERNVKITKNLTLYPYWTANKYTVTFAGGEFGVGTPKEVSGVTFNKTTTAPDALFTRDGYIQIGWTATVIEITEDADGNEVFTSVEDTIELKGKTAPVTGDVTYTPVWEKVVVDTDYEISGTSFGAVCEDYTVPAAQTITITNKGNATVTYTLPTSANYNIAVKSGKLALEPEATVVISVQPKAGLAVGGYNESLAFACDFAELAITFDATFKVSAHSFDKYVSNGDATYTSDGTKTAKCTNGCGAEDTIADVGSMKVYSVDNNTVDGLLPEYIYHKTVRFTVYGSGMDNAEAVEGSKRYLPISWYVNDTHNGEFTEDSDFVVNYVHTDFGDFTLTVKYVEQEMNADGEWVATGLEDEKTFEYSIGPSERDEQEVIRPNTIVSIIFGLFGYFFELIGGFFG